MRVLKIKKERWAGKNLSLFWVFVKRPRWEAHTQATPKRVYNNFFCALFHDLPEALTRDIINPVKYSVEGLNEIILEYEVKKVEEEILPLLNEKIQDEFRYLLGINGNRKNEFSNRIYINGQVREVDNLNLYNEDKFNPIDGVAIKSCDKLAAFCEAVISIRNGIKPTQLSEGKDRILEDLKKRAKVNGVDFFKLAKEIENYFKAPS